MVINSRGVAYFKIVTGW